MKRITVSTTLLILFAAALFVSRTAAAQSATAPCLLSRTAGNYSFSDSGTIVGIGARAAVGSLSFDATGNVTGKVTASLNGNVSTTSLAGTYSVNPDCSGVTTFSESDQSGNLILTATVQIVWDDNMREARFLFTSVTLANGTPLATVVNGDARKVVP
ncbi:MAG TPA: hypothetical protein VJQ54_19540 [Candidatus Sulfotelmatobacter sp.]|nr:hypothetical protein [Candidatus Sulfotelmatobacter sp.]